MAFTSKVCFTVVLSFYLTYKKRLGLTFFEKCLMDIFSTCYMPRTCAFIPPNSYDGTLLPLPLFSAPITANL